MLETLLAPLLWIRMIFGYSIMLLKHKTCIFITGIYFNWKLRCFGVHLPYHRLWFHDWVKFLPVEFFPYAHKFFGDFDLNNPQHRQEWIEAFHHHYTRMDHHWQYHVPGYFEGMSRQQILSNAKKIPIEAIMEIPVDLMAAQLSYSIEKKKNEKKKE